MSSGQQSRSHATAGVLPASQLCSARRVGTEQIDVREHRAELGLVLGRPLPCLRQAHVVDEDEADRLVRAQVLLQGLFGALWMLFFGFLPHYGCYSTGRDAWPLYFVNIISKSLKSVLVEVRSPPLCDLLCTYWVASTYTGRCVVEARGSPHLYTVPQCN